MHLNVSSVKWRPFCLSLNVLPSATQKAVRLHWRLLCCIRHYANILLKMLFSDLSAIQVACQYKWSMPAIYSRALLCKTTIQVWSTKYHITPLIFFQHLSRKSNITKLYEIGCWPDGSLVTEKNYEEDLTLYYMIYQTPFLTMQESHKLLCSKTCLVGLLICAEALVQFFPRKI